MSLTGHARQVGFSLLELLVAFAIMAMSIGMIYRAMGSSVHSVAAVSLQQQAVAIAEGLLNTRDSVTEQGWQESGVTDAFTWQVVSDLVSSTPSSPQSLPLHHVSVVVSWTDGISTRQVVLQTFLPQRQPMPGEVIR